MNQLLSKHKKGYANFTKSMTLVILLTLMFLNTSAQNDAKITSIINDPVQAFIEKNRSTPLVKYYQNDPSDHVAVKAMRYSVELEDEANIKQSQPEDILRLRIELAELMTLINKTDVYVHSGMTYEKAKSTVSRQLQSEKQAIDAKKPVESNQSENNSVPTLFFTPGN